VSGHEFLLSLQYLFFLWAF